MSAAPRREDAERPSGGGLVSDRDSEPRGKQAAEGSEERPPCCRVLPLDRCRLFPRQPVPPAYVLTTTALQQNTLAHTPLLRRRANQHDLALHLPRLQRRHNSNRRRHTRHRDQVMPARMPDTRQRIVLRVEAESTPRAALVRCPKRRREVLVPALDLEARVLEVRSDVLVRLDLMEAELGVVGEVERELGERGGGVFDGFADRGADLVSAK